MKTNFLCLALVLSGGVFDCSRIVRADEAVAKTVSSNTDLSFESLLNAAFPGRQLHELNLYGPDARQLSSERWNQLAVAAARELSLQTTNGLVITKETVAGLPNGSLATDSPEQAALRRLCWSNEEQMTFLRDASNNRLFNDAGVIGPLIAMLDYPGEKTIIRQEAAQILCQLTLRGRPEQTQIYLYVDGENNPKRPQYAAWWREWWAKNKSKHPVFDSTVEALVSNRIAGIELQLDKDVAKNYSELNYLKPKYIRFDVHPVNVIDVRVDSSILSAIGSRTAPDGTWREAGEEDHIYLRITAGFITPPFSPVSDDTPKRWQSLKKEVFRETIPDTDIVITVQAASKDAEFVRQVRACLAKLSPMKEN